MKHVVIIPARIASTRFPGKPLAKLKGVDGVARSLIEHTWNAGLTAQSADAVFVATDSDQIAQTVNDFGGKTLMTSAQCRNGTERCAEALAQLPSSVELVVNLQGDAPLTPGYFMDTLITSLISQPKMGVATPVIACDAKAKQRLVNDRAHGRIGATTAVFNKDKQALYFSKEVIPFGKGDAFHHVGVYAYRPDVLKQYSRWPAGNLEQSEGLEQLRFLENRESILCVEMDARINDFWEVNNPEDIPLVEKLLGASNAI